MEEGKAITMTVRRGDGVLCTVGSDGKYVPVRVEPNQEPVKKKLEPPAKPILSNDEEA
jgi:hypothetical protein